MVTIIWTREDRPGETVIYNWRYYGEVDGAREIVPILVLLPSFSIFIPEVLRKRSTSLPRVSVDIEPHMVL